MKGSLLRPALPARYAYVVLAMLPLLLAAVSILFTVSYYHDEQASQQRQGQVFERKLCTTLDGLASRKPPAGPVADNPSRAYLQWLHGQLSQLGPDVGCKR